MSVSDIPVALAGKADLDPATGFVESSQIAPLQGRQTGVKTGNGGFVSTDPALCLSTAKTLVVTFKCDGTPNSFLYFDHGGSNANLGVSIFIASNRLFCNIGPKTLVSFNPESGKLYQVVISFDKNGTSAGYMNSVKDRETTDYSTITDPTHFCLGALSDGSGSFSGVILGARLFNYALTASEVVTLWNGGEPERYMLPLSGEMRTGLVAEYIAAGLLADKWRDTSGAGLDLPYVPTATGGTAVLDYQQSLLTPSGSPLHDLFVAAGAVWDDTAKSWTVADYTGIDTPTMTKIYEQSHNVLNGVDWTSKLLYATIPVNLPPRADVTGYNGALTTARSAFAGSTLEKAYIAVNDDTAAGLIDCRNLFRSCSKLKTVVGIILLSDSVAINTDVFAYCPLLERVRIRNLRSSLTFAHSPLLSLESLQYLVENAGNTAAITVTVHADVYAKLTDSSNAEWYAVNAAAQARQIGFAATWGAFVEKDAATVGDLAVYDKTAGAIRFVKGETLSAAQLPESLTPLAVVYARQGDKVLIVSLDNVASELRWAASYEVALSGFDLATGGTIVLRIGSETEVSITYAAGGTLADLVSATNTAFRTTLAYGSPLTSVDRGGWAAVADDASGRMIITANGYMSWWATITVISGATMTTRPENVDYQTTITSVLIEGETEYIRRKNGVNATNVGCNFAKFLQYRSVNGAVPTSNVPLGSATIVNQASFETSEFCAELRAAYADYASYLFGEHMAEYPSAYGAMLRDGRTNTAKIGRLRFTDIYGQSKPCYPAAAAALEYGVAVKVRRQGSKRVHGGCHQRKRSTCSCVIACLFPQT